MAEEVILPLFNDTGVAITGGAASTGLKIRRGSDGYLFDWNDTTFKNAGWTTLSAVFTEIDATNVAGYYKKSGIAISGWNDGWYQVIATYSGTPTRNAAEDWLVKGGKIVEQRTADNLDAQVSLSALETTVQSILTDTAEIGAAGGGLTVLATQASVSGLNNLSAAQVNAEVVDVIATDTYAEVGAAPAATSSLKDKINWIFALARNKITQTATTQTLRNDADGANIATSPHSDDGSTHIRGEWN